MSDDLVRRLRDRRVCSLAQNSCRNDWACEQAADRIEELEAKLEALDHAYDSIVQALQFEALRTDDAEAKLAKAVEAFTDLEQDCEADYPPSHGAMKYYIQRALAELKGEQP